MSKSKRKNMLEALAASMNREAVPDLIAWIRNLNRKEAIHAFTEGPVRDVAYAIEYALRMERETVPALPRPPTLRATEQCQRCGFVQYIREESEDRDINSWQPIETAPKDGSRILLATPTGKISGGMWSLQYRVWSWPYVMVEPTHWMPIPEPPIPEPPK